MNKSIHIALIEDHPEFREAVELAVEDEPGLKLAVTFGTAERAIDYFEANRGSNPDILLLDLSLPGMSGLTAIRRLKSLAPEMQIIVLTQSDREQDVIQSISSGASGYLLKSATVEQICASIRTVNAGGAPLEPSIAKYIIDTLKSTTSWSRGNSPLSPREMDVLQLIAKGKVKKEIASELGIGTETVITHVKHIYEKLDATNAPAAVAKAFGIGILPG